MEISKKARIEKIQQETSIKEKRNWAQMEKKQRHAQVEEVQKSSRTKEPIGKRVEMKKTAAATVIERPSNAMSTKVPLHLLDLKKMPKPTSNEVHVKQQVMSVIEAKQREVIEERFREMEEKQLDWQQLELEQHLEQKRIEAQWQQERINQQLKVLEAKQQLQQVVSHKCLDIYAHFLFDEKMPLGGLVRGRFYAGYTFMRTSCQCNKL